MPTFQLTKKTKYMLQAALTVLFIYLVSTAFPLKFTQLIFFALLLSSFGALLVHFPNVKITNFFYSILLPFHLILGAVLFLESFPNLGSVFKLAVIVGFGALHYLVALVDNVFLVVHDRKELIPLYRVATTWSLILIIVLAIPLFSGVLKLNLAPYMQSIVITFFSFLFCMYQVWSLRFDEQSKRVEMGEQTLYSLLVGLFVFGSSMSTAFFPSEAFLRSLFLATVLMFGLSYVGAHLKNAVSKRFIIEYFLISSLFLTLMLLFTT
jgi:hypothetical protein